MRSVCLTGWAKHCYSAELIIEIPGPIYVLYIEFEPGSVPDGEMYAVCGCLTFFSSDVPHERGIVEDAKNRLLEYFGHLLLYCFSQSKYIPPFRLIDCLTLKEYGGDDETRTSIINFIQKGIKELGYRSLPELMPILTFASDEDVRLKILDAKYYQELIEEPGDIEVFLNLEGSAALVSLPVFEHVKASH